LTLKCYYDNIKILLNHKNKNMSETSPSSGNYELQQQFLRAEQERISAELFEKGVTSRIVSVVPRSSGVIADVSGMGQLDKLFVPGMRMLNDQGHRERELSLVAVSTDPDIQSNSYSYFRLGRIDDAGILYPYPNVPADDADVVLQAAKEMEVLKTEGVLRNMSFNLLGIDNPNTAITLMPPTEQA
jgi:hypothetical protein